MIFSGITPVLIGSSRIATCGVGQEVIVLGMTFSNTVALARVMTVSVYRQATDTTETFLVRVGSQESVELKQRIGLQPGDHLDVWGDNTGVTLLWTLDADNGINPVATGFVVKGPWSNAVPYSANDVVSKNGSSYVAIQNSTAKDPETQTAYWLLLLDGAGIQSVKLEILGGVPANLDTLNKLAAAVDNDPDYAGSVEAALALKATTTDLADVAISGNYEDLTGTTKLKVRRLFFSRELI